MDYSKPWFTINIEDVAADKKNTYHKWLNTDNEYDSTYTRVEYVVKKMVATEKG